MSRSNAVRASDSLLLEGAQLCLVRLADISRKLRTNTEKLDFDSIVGFKQEISGLAKEVVTSKHMHKSTGEIVTDELGKRKPEDGTGPEDIKRNVRHRLAEIKEAADVKQDTEYLGVVSILLDIGKSEDIDADMVVIDSGMTERDVICPYSMKTFEKPMKKYEHEIVRLLAEMTC